MKTILFADDDRSARAVFKRVFEDEGYSVVLAEDGNEALELLESQKPDVAVLDICMPGKDGLEVAREMCSAEPELPVILYTGYDDVCTQDKRARFATACVEKRTDLTELKLAIFRALSSRKGRPAPRVGLPPAAD